MNYFYIVLQQIGIFVIYVFIGIGAIKGGILTKTSLGVLSQFIAKISMPALIFTSTINGATRAELIDALPMFAIIATMYISLYAIFYAVSGLLGMTGNRRHVYEACSMFSSVGFMGIPLVVALFPDRGYLYIAIFTIIDQFLLWTLGIDLTAPVDRVGGHSIAGRLRNMINPATVGVILAVVGVFAGIRLPAILDKALLNVGATTTPLAMIYIGGLFCCIPIQRYIPEKKIYLIVAIKMIIVPLILYYGLTALAITTHEIVVTISVLCGLPTMVAVAMLAQIQGSDGDFGAAIIFVTTVCSVVTLPFICYFMG